MKELSDVLELVGTLMYEDSTVPDNSTNWRPHRNIWKVIAHVETQDFLSAPIVKRNSIQLVRQEDIPD